MKRRIAALALCAAVCLSLTPSALAVEEAEKTEENSVTWEELEERVRAGSATAIALSERAGQLGAIDYDRLMDSIRDDMNDLADMQWMMSQLASNSYISPGTAASAVGAESQLASGYSAYKEAYDDLKDGVTQQDNADLIRQLNDGVNQVVAGGQTLYIAILGLEQTLEDGNRGLATIDRTLTELRLRQKLGQVSRDQVESVEQTRISTISQLRTLESTITTYKSQFQVLLGEEPTGELTLAPLPEKVEVVIKAGEEMEAGTETDAETEDGEAGETWSRFDWTDLDYDADLARAKENSWTLYDAKNTLDDAEDDWKDGRNSAQKYKREMAQHAWNAAQATYNGTVQSFEISFKTLYDSLADYEQVWESKKAAVTYQEKLYSNAQMKYQRGMISRNALLSAQDDLESARSAEERAWRDLFSARNSYRNAVEYGLVSNSNSN